MARYVLIEFDDNGDADSFVKEFELGDVFWMHSDALYHGNGWRTLSSRIRGLFAKPTKFCECAKPSDKSVKGEKWGWWLHRDCAKPKSGSWQHPKNLSNPDVPTKFRDLYLGIVEPAGVPHYSEEAYKEWVAKYS